MINLNKYKNAIFLFDGITIEPDQESNLLNKYLIKNEIDSYLIITAFDSNIKKITHNRKRNYSLKEDLKKYVFFDCYGCDNIENPTHLEESFFVKNISLKDSIALCKKYDQDCILWANNNLPKLYDCNGCMI